MKRSNNLFYFFCFVIISTVALAEKPAEYFKYDLVTGGFPIMFVPSDGEVFQKPFVFPATYCEVEAEYICFESNEFWFAVPKREIKVGDSWVYGKRKYVVKFSRNDIEILSGDKALYTIHCFNNEGALIGEYLYNRSQGMLYMSYIADKVEQWSFISKSRVGFGATIKN
jgi:hypothetical protein